MVVRDELLKFHGHYYSSNIMGLAVLGQQVVFYSFNLIHPGCTFYIIYVKKVVKFHILPLLLSPRGGGINPATF